MIYFIYALTSVFFIGLDQWTKYLTVKHIPLGETKEALSPIFSFTYVKNTGAAWSILQGRTFFFFVTTLIAVGFVLYFLIRYGKKNYFFGFSLALVLAGALGNFIDRMRLKFVVDMIQLDFIDFPIFNVADMCLVIGVALIFIFILKTDDDFFKGGR